MKIGSSAIWLWVGATALVACGDGAAVEKTDNTSGPAEDSADNQTGGDTSAADDDVLRDDNEIVVVKPRCKAQAECAVGDNCGGSDSCFVCDAGACMTLWEHVARTVENTLTLSVSAEWPFKPGRTEQTLCVVDGSGEPCAASGFRITAFFGPSCARASNFVAASGDRLIAAYGADFSEYPQVVAIDLPVGVELSLGFEMFPAAVGDGAMHDGRTAPAARRSGDAVASHCAPFTARAGGAGKWLIASGDWRVDQDAAGGTP